MRMSNVSSADIDADPNANSNYVAVAELTASDNEVSKDGCARGHTKRSGTSPFSHLSHPTKS